MSEKVDLADALVIVRTADRTLVFSTVTGSMELQQQYPEIKPSSEAGRYELVQHPWELHLSGFTPGYVQMPNTPEPNRKEG